MAHILDQYGKVHDLPGPYRTMGQIRAANTTAGYHFFEPSTMGFFDSRIEEGPLYGCLFVTSEQFHGTHQSGKRLYTVRVCAPDGDISTVGTFQQFTEADDAVDFIHAHAKES